MIQPLRTPIFMTTLISRCTPILLGLVATQVAMAKPEAKPKGGIEGKAAPEWEVEEWISLPKGVKEGPELADLKGKTIYIYCFQSWCPGCHSSGFPTLQKVSEHFKDDDEVAFVVMQTVFEGFAANTPDKGRAVAKKYDLEHLPFAQSGTAEKKSRVMKAYRTRGTPWTIIIGPDGKVAFNDFHLKPDRAIELIDKLEKG